MQVIAEAMTCAAMKALARDEVQRSTAPYQYFVERRVDVTGSPTGGSVPSSRDTCVPHPMPEGDVGPWYAPCTANEATEHTQFLDSSRRKCQ